MNKRRWMLVYLIALLILAGTLIVVSPALLIPTPTGPATVAAAAAEVGLPG